MRFQVFKLFDILRDTEVLYKLFRTTFIKLLWSEFFDHTYISILRIAFDALSCKILYCVRSLFADTIPYIWNNVPAGPLR